MTVAEKLLEAEEADEPVGIFGYDWIAPEDFLRLEADLFATLTPAWCAVQVAAREAAPEPPAPKPRPINTGEATARRVLELLLRRYKPGDVVTYQQVQEVTRYSKSHAQGVMYKLKQLELWPFAPPAFKRAESQPKEARDVLA
jgi:hypothetical protein